MNAAAKQRIWLTATALVLAGVACINVLDTAARVPPPPRFRAPADGVTRHEAQLAPVRAALERHRVRGPLGYLTELTPEQMRADHAAMQDYFLTQFALVPYVLEAEAAGCEWAIGRFLAPPDARVLRDDFIVVENIGAGFWLLRRSAR